MINGHGTDGTSIGAVAKLSPSPTSTVFLMALRNVALAHGGLRDVSKKTKLNRETLYRILSEKGNPALVTLHSILQALGLQIMIAPKKRKMKRAA